MNFHPDKCHVVKITVKRDKSCDFIYRLGILDLEYVSVEKGPGNFNVILAEAMAKKKVKWIFMEDYEH